MQRKAICDGEITAFARAAIAASHSICAGVGVGIEGCCRGSEGLVCHFEVAHSVINITDYEFGTSTAENESRREGAFVHLCRVEVVRTYRYI